MNYQMPSHDIDDLAMDYFERLVQDEYRRLRQWRQEGPLDAWLGRIAKNLCIDYFRRESGRSNYEELSEQTSDIDPTYTNDQDPYTMNPADAIVAMDKRTCVRKASRRLHDRDQALLRRWSESYSYREIAHELEMTVNNVGVAISRAVQRLRSEMRGLCPEYAIGGLR